MKARRARGGGKSKKKRGGGVVKRMKGTLKKGGKLAWKHKGKIAAAGAAAGLAALGAEGKKRHSALQGMKGKYGITA